MNLYKYRFCVANTIMDFTSSLSMEELGIINKMTPFVYEQTYNSNTEDINLKWEKGIPSLPKNCKLIYDPGAIWKMFFDDKNYYAQFSHERKQGLPAQKGLLITNSKWDKMTLYEDVNDENFRSLFNMGGSELPFRTKILWNNGLVFHASGIDDNGEGIVFVGHSSEGKTTQMNLWNNQSGAILINEDRIAVQPIGGKFICYGTPWGRKDGISFNHNVPLNVIILIKKDKSNYLKKISTTEAAPLLLTRSFLPFWDKFLLKKAIDNLNEILKKTPVYILHCKPEPEVVALVRSVL